MKEFPLKYKYIAAATAVLSLIIVIYAVYAVFDFHSMLYEPIVEKNGERTEKDSELAGEESDHLVDDPVLNVLLIGVDSEDGNGRSDTIMIGRYHQEKNEMGLVSIPRDTRVKLPGRGYEKINHAYAYGGVSYLKETLENFIDIKIHNYVKVDFKGFENVVDILGGVEMYVEQDMYYYDDWLEEVVVDLDKGEQVLDGDKSLQYVRWRGGTDADIGRVQRQQRFLKKLAVEVFSFKSLRHFKPMAEEVSENVVMDFRLREIFFMLSSVYSFDWNDMETEVLPGRDKRIDGIWYWKVDEGKAQEIVDELV